MACSLPIRVVEGTFIDAEGYLRCTVGATRGAQRLLRSLEDEGVAIAEEVAERAQEADVAHDFTLDDRRAVAGVLEDRTHAFDDAIIKALNQLAERIRPRSGTN